MIDYIRLYSRNIVFATQLYNNRLLKPYKRTERTKGKYKILKEVKEYKGILFEFYYKNGHFTKLEIHIKPHYYHNDNLHNANDFSAYNSIKTLKEIIKTFNLPVEEFKIIGLEFGTNIISPINITELIDKTLYHEKNVFKNSDDYLIHSKISVKNSINGKASKYKAMKYYAKGIQYPEYCHKDTLRIEIKSKKSQYINKFGIYNLNDLLKPLVHGKIYTELKKEIIKFLKKLKNTKGYYLNFTLKTNVLPN